jgi:hypothetical protein
MNDDSNFDEKQSLQIIQSMIHRVQGSVRDNGFYFMLWGWLVFIAAVSQYIMIYMGYGEPSGLVWAVLMPLGAVISIIRGRRDGKKEKVKTYTEELLYYALTSFIVSLFIVMLFVPMTASSAEEGWVKAYPMIMMVYGCWLFISGGAIKFRPLIIGAVIDWACAIAGFFIHSYDIILLLAFAVLAGYIIPGHMLKAKYGREEKHEAI